MAPKSPLDKPATSSHGHHRRPSNSRRSSSDKSAPKSPANRPANSKEASSKDTPVDPASIRLPETPLEAPASVTTANDIVMPAGPSVVDADDDDDGATPPAKKKEAGPSPNPLNAVHGSGKGDSPQASAEELARLRTAVHARQVLLQNRQNLAKQLYGRPQPGTPGATAREKSRVSPIHEEMSPPSSTPRAALETASTESTKTVRGLTPHPLPPTTPSYPFPQMRTSSYPTHRPFMALSPTVPPVGGYAASPYDVLLSGSVTPASTLNFRPIGPAPPPEDPLFPSPNLYELSLMLAAEPGLDPWWTTVVQIMRDVYKADRVTLSVPADSTDVENVPWGQKATFSAVEEDELSLTYLPRGSSMVPSSVGTNETSHSEATDPADDAFRSAVSYLESVRPGIPSRRSFTAVEDSLNQSDGRTAATTARAPARPAVPKRAQSYMAAGATPEPMARNVSFREGQLNPHTLAQHDQNEGENLWAWENPDGATRETQGRVFSVLQALDYDADPLIDSSGVLRVLERGKLIALTRDYPYLDQPASDEAASKTSHGSKHKRSPPAHEDLDREGLALRSSLFSNKGSRRSTRSLQSLEGDKGKNLPTLASRVQSTTKPLPRYEEYEQTPLSPWAQSPAPSPAVRAETAENPFFANVTVDEDSFNPQESPLDYNFIRQPEAIGTDRSLSVLHIPLFHPLLSKPVQSLRLNSAAMELKSPERASRPDLLPSYVDPSKIPASETKEKRTPIAILSILSSTIPYPSNLRHSLEHLAPHMATSFSLCRHYSNLEVEVAGLTRKRPQTAGFGAVVPSGGRYLPDRTLHSEIQYTGGEDGPAQPSAAGSMTSPSDYSGLSRSAAGSPIGTPGWDPSLVGMTMDKRSSGGGGSPSLSGGDGYFTSRMRPGVGRVDTGSVSSIAGARNASKESSPAESRHPRRSLEGAAPEAPEVSIDAKLSPPKGPPTASSESSTDDAVADDGMSHSRPQSTGKTYKGRPSAGKPLPKDHTLLHSYGAEFGATFQSLPTTTVPTTKNTLVSSPPSRSNSMSAPTDMPPPSDRLKGLMLDSLPAHVFVALPPNGEIVWVNSRYLTYRGQTVPDLYNDPWGSIHPDEREDYLKAWAHALRTGEQFKRQVRIRRFDGTYRWFYTRAVGSRDIRGVIVQWYGSYMDIHDQHIAEVRAARQEEIEASEAKHRQLANLIPQIIFVATDEEGVTFANEQWLYYTGQDFNDSLGLGFIDYVHPEDLAKCQMPSTRPSTPSKTRPTKPHPSRENSQVSSGAHSSTSLASEAPTETTVRGIHETLSRANSSSTGSVYEMSTADLSELARKGVIKISTDANNRLSYTTEVRLRSRTGEYRWHLVRCVEVDNINLGYGDGSWFGACTDINDHKLLETTLKDAMESKGKFLSNMSHEIRTPLIGISGMISFLQDTVLNDEQIDYTNTIQSSAQSLLNIINDILDLSKVDAGMMKLSYEWFHTRSLVEEVNEMVSTMAITKRLELNYMVDVDVPEMVKGDKFRIRQVLLNVIGNAIKFTTVGEVFSRCRIYKNDDGVEDPTVGENEVLLEYSIIDTGSGFTQEEAELIFRPFSQIDGSSTRQHGGSGLGLVISRQLVELHGGKMEGSAVPGKGSIFKFTAKFGLPTLDDHPEAMMPPSKPPSRWSSVQESAKVSAAAGASPLSLKQININSPPVNKVLQIPPKESPKGENADSSTGSPGVASAGSSVPSSGSIHSHPTVYSPTSPAPSGLIGLGEAARATGSDLTQLVSTVPLQPTNLSMELTMPEHIEKQPEPASTTPRPRKKSIARYEPMSPRRGNFSNAEKKRFRPPMFSILILCPQKHSREATTQHIEMTLPKDAPHQITALATIAEAQAMIRDDDPVLFTHIVLNLGSAEDIVALMDRIIASSSFTDTSIVILSDPVQRQEVTKLATGYDYDQLTKANRVIFVYKPVKPSRFAVIFDPDQEQDLSIDRNRSSAQQQVANQRQNYVDVGKRLGHRGFKVLLVEDNLVNQKVLLKFLSKVGIDVDLAIDGVVATDKIFARSHGYYSLVLCDLHMPRKDGYQTCIDVRAWEAKHNYARMPIIALSANVMADVLEKCNEAGFNDYVTKPVDFKDLSAAMSNLLDPDSAEAFEADETSGESKTTKVERGELVEKGRLPEGDGQ